MHNGYCPSCQKAVRLPEVDPATRVRCPLCRAEHTAASFAEEGLPTVELVEPASETPAAPSTAIVDISDPVAQEVRQPQFDFKETLPSPSQIAPLILASGKHATRRPSPVGGFVKVVLGGVVGAVIAQLVIWWLPPPYRSDPLNLAPRVPANFHWLVPVEFRQNGLEAGAGPATDSDSLDEGASGNNARVGPADASAPRAGEDRGASQVTGSEHTKLTPPDGQLTETDASKSEQTGPDASGDGGTGSGLYGIRNADVFSGVEIQAAVRDVVASASRLAVAVELQRASLGQQWYRALENLCYRLTFGDPSDSSTVSQLAAIESLVRAAWSNSAQRLILLESQQRIWADSSPRMKTEHPDGCLVVGEVLDVAPRGPLFVTSIRLASGPKTIAVLSRVDPTARELNAYQAGDVIAVLGVLVNRPESGLIGFTGPEAHVVWGGRPIRLGPTRTPAAPP